LLKDENAYQIFKLKNHELTFTADVSSFLCELNDALYFVEMEEDGRKFKYSFDKLISQYRTGYCDVECLHDMKFMNDIANALD
jgi:cellulose 1,4-beta-cellobiosidase